ncbi:MAG TPA: FtsW/RodA/SpoVE family cell cycle protein, partial [Bryobacteraceae bacterium]|nr:FtsW/RodA/SpoVE family cell cycle protein [Bryobacteraceae bacterium]
MAVTRSWERPGTALASRPEKPPVPPERRRERLLLLAASVLAACGLALVLRAKIPGEPAGVLLLRRGVSAEQIRAVAGPEHAAAIAAEIESRGGLPSVGVLAKSGIPVSRVKPFLIVRTRTEYVRQAAYWLALYFAAFWTVHLLWRWRRFRGDPWLLPVVHVLTGFGLALALTLRDPLRDTLEFSKFSWGAALGCALLVLPLVRGWDHRRWSAWVYTPLLAAFALLVLLLVRGSGPAGNSAKVNLGPVQPIEAIKILLVFFVAGYFASKWEWLRELRERRLPRGLRWLDLPRFTQALPVMCAVAAALVLLFLLKDLGPALVVGFLFLGMYAVARGRAALAILGLVLVIAGVTVGYKLGAPATVVGRVGMWLSPWNNDVRGGDQLAHAFWALATGGPFGSGPGRGDPALIPAGHTDLVLPAIGEEWGFCGVVAIGLLFGLLCARALRAGL